MCVQCWTGSRGGFYFCCKMLACSENHIQHKIHMSKYIFMHRITYSVSHHGVIKSNIRQYNVMCYSEEEKENSTYQNTVFNHCNFRLPWQNIKRIKWSIITLLWKLLLRKMWPVQCTFVHKKQCHGFAHTKICCP